MLSRSSLFTFAKGYAMGAANVIPGVSGGTVAFITGILETLINALKSFDSQALRYLTAGRVGALWTHINGRFLAPLALGVLASFATLAKLLEHLFDHHPVLIWAFFFGLILASIFYVGRSVERWSAGPVISVALGCAIAMAIALMKPAGENANTAYLILCGVIAICSMIIPGLSGSFVLILLGNYRLVLGALSSLAGAAGSFRIAEVARPLAIILPVTVGAVLGLLAFSHVISWVFRRFRDVAIALMTGFVAGSLLVIWPWKTEVLMRDETGQILLKDGGRKLVQGYEWHWPSWDTTTWFAGLLILAGILMIVVMEALADRSRHTPRVQADDRRELLAPPDGRS